MCAGVARPRACAGAAWSEPSQAVAARQTCRPGPMRAKHVEDAVKRSVLWLSRRVWPRGAGLRTRKLGRLRVAARMDEADSQARAVPNDSGAAQRHFSCGAVIRLTGSGPWDGRIRAGEGGALEIRGCLLARTDGACGKTKTT